jgi:hypothetical protein
MIIALTRGHRQVLLVSRDHPLGSLWPLDHREGFRSRSFAERGRAVDYLRGFLTDRSQVLALRRALLIQLPAGQVLRLSDRELLDRVADLLLRGNLVLVERAGRPSYPPLAASPAPSASRPPASVLPPPATSSPPPPVQELEPPTTLPGDPLIPPETDLVQQARTLEQAATDGTTVCEA